MRAELEPLQTTTVTVIATVASVPPSLQRISPLSKSPAKSTSPNLQRDRGTSSLRSIQRHRSKQTDLAFDNTTSTLWIPTLLAYHHRIDPLATTTPQLISREREHKYLLSATNNPPLSDSGSGQVPSDPGVSDPPASTNHLHTF